jgi:signal transduction histidine kinase
MWEAPRRADRGPCFRRTPSARKLRCTLDWLRLQKHTRTDYESPITNHESRTNLRERLTRLEVLHRVSNAIHTVRAPQKILRLVLREAVRITRANSGSIVLINPNTGLLDIEAAVGLPKKAQRLKLKPGEGVTGWVAQRGQPLRVPDVTADPRYVKARPSVRSELAAPLEVEGQVMGVLNVDSDRVHAFSEADEELLVALARHSARVLHNAWLLETLRLKTRQLETLVAVGQTIVSAPSLDETLRLITAQGAKLLRGKLCSLLLLDPERRELTLRACHGAGKRYATKPNLPVAESQVGVVVRGKRPLAVLNVQESHRYHHIEVARAEGLVSLLSVPLLYRGEATGVLNVYTGEQHRFDNEEIRLLSALAHLSAIAIEKARLYEKVVDVEEQLRQNEKLSALGLLAAEIAHEIRNPLTVMKMLFHSLGLRFDVGDARATDAAVIHEKMEQLDKIVERLLRFARTSEPEFQRANLNAIIEDVLLLVRHKLGQQGIELRKKLAEPLAEVPCDPTQIEQVLLNLILNAAQAMPQGGTLTLTTGSDNDRVSFTVGDTGQGMTAEQQSKLFQPFLTTKPSGTGIGLAIVRKIVDTHRGRVEVRSRPGKGTQFRVALPLSQANRFPPEHPKA